MARPKVEQTAKERRKQLTLSSHPEWLVYEDVQHLLKLYRGYGIGKKLWLHLVATGQMPGYEDPFTRRIMYRWSEVRGALDERMKKVG